MKPVENGQVVELPYTALRPTGMYSVVRPTCVAAGGVVE